MISRSRCSGASRNEVPQTSEKGVVTANAVVTEVYGVGGPLTAYEQSNNATFLAQSREDEPCDEVRRAPDRLKLLTEEEEGEEDSSLEALVNSPP